MLLAPNPMSPPIQDKILEHNLRRHKLTTLEVVSVDAYETKWKYHDMLTTTAITGFLIPSTPTILSRQQIYGRCTTKSFYDMPSTTKIMALPTTSTSS
jgi:hypothetical protein